MTALYSRPLSTPHIGHTPRVTVALVNNTSDRALAATEAQFLALLRSSSADIQLRVEFFTCPGIVRAVPPRTIGGGTYCDMTHLLDAHVDALVVTGMEPTTPDLHDEPVWHPLTRLIDWADRTRTPSIWSCLAAHAAVLRLDGIERTLHPSKVSDVLRCEIAAGAHPLMNRLPAQWWMPHSRYYGLPEATLVASGYQVLSRTAAAGVDVFVANDQSPFVFLQGHPEYQPESLMKEYRRDLRRYFDGSRDEYPTPPTSYFGQEARLLLEQIRQVALQNPGRARADGKMLNQVLALANAGKAPAQWDNVATAIFANWMATFVLGARSGDGWVPPRVETDPARRRISVPELVCGT